jgi:hypothetical protein
VRRVLVAAAAFALAAGAAPAHGAVTLRTGCDAARPAIAYHPGGDALSPQPRRRPLPCLMTVPGRAGESATVEMSRSGRIFYAPLVLNSDPAPLDDRGPAKVSSSDDGGAHWQTLDSGGDDHILDVPPWMNRDPQTGRIWFASVLPPLCGAKVSWSDDDGRTWQDNPTVGCPGMGSMRILEGPPPPGGAAPNGYPHVVYYCANLSDLSNSNLWCYRSLDGGQSYSFTGAFADPPPGQSCNSKHPARPGTVGPDGSLYFPVYDCGVLSVAISRDEGASWQYSRVDESPVQDLYISSMAADAAGNIYLAWIAGTSTNTSGDGIMGSGKPMLSVSRDHGATWSRPVLVAPPGVANARHVAITAGSPGRIAVSFLANSDGSDKLSGYLTSTDDALSAQPIWWGAPLNDPAQPLISTNDSETFGDRLFFFTDTLSPSGQAWAAFHCAKTAPCPGQRVGVLGRLSAPQPPPRCVDRRKFRFRLHHAPHARVVKVAVFVNGKRVVARRGRNLVAVTLRRLPRGVFRVKVVATQSTGSKLISRRTYRGCRKSRPRTRAHHSRSR